jgi:hypothetical protein
VSTYQHHVSGFFVKRDEADIALAKLLARGLPNANSNAALKGLLVDGAIGTALGALGELALIAANVTLFVGRGNEDRDRCHSGRRGFLQRHQRRLIRHRRLTVLLCPGPPTTLIHAHRD